MAFTYVPNGIAMDAWTPAKVGEDFEMSRILAPLAPYKDKLLLLSGLNHHNGFPLGDGAGDHAPRRCDVPHGRASTQDVWRGYRSGYFGGPNGSPKS